MRRPAAAQLSSTQAGAGFVGVATVAAAGAGYAVLVVAARVLTPEENAQFLVFWSTLFGLFGVLGGIQQESTRSVGSRELDGSTAPGARVLTVGLSIGAVLAGLVAATSPWWLANLIGTEHAGILSATLALAVVAYAGHCATLGALAGQRSWPPSALLLGTEAVARLVLVVAAALALGTPAGLEVASAVSAATWVLLSAIVPLVRRGAAARGDAPTGVQARRMLTAMVASAASAVLVVGFPTVLRASTTPEVWAGAAPLVLAVSMTRAPLLMPLNAFQGFAISHFLAHRDRGMAALLPVLGAIAGVTAIGAAAAAVVGPTLMTAIFGAAYYVTPGMLAVLTVAGGALALLTMTGSAVLAVGRHRQYATGWVVAAVAAGALLTVDLPLGARTGVSLILGPLCGIAIHLSALRAPSVTTRARSEVPGSELPPAG